MTPSLEENAVNVLALRTSINQIGPLADGPVVWVVPPADVDRFCRTVVPLKSPTKTLGDSARSDSRIIRPTRFPFWLASRAMIVPLPVRVWYAKLNVSLVPLIAPDCPAP